MEYTQLEDPAKTNIRRISDYEWMSLFRDRPNTNFLNEGPELIPEPNLLKIEYIIKNKVQKIAKPKKQQYSLEL